MATEICPRVCIVAAFVCWVGCGDGDGRPDASASNSDGTTGMTGTAGTAGTTDMTSMTSMTGITSMTGTAPTSDTSPTSDTAPTSETGASATSGSTGPLDETGDPTATSTPPDSESGMPLPDMGGPQCLSATQPCTDPAQCCQDEGLTCDVTTLGQVCCGLEGTGCATPNGEDCCGDLLCIAGTCIGPGAVPPFKAPYPCGQSWTYSHHDQEVRRALDFIDNGGNTNGAPCLAALEGVATRHVEGGAGNYIVIDHGGGWTTYYFHLQSFSVDDNTFVQQGQEIGKVGSTGNSSGAHIHFEELRYGEGRDIWLDGQLLTPYPGTYGQASLVSGNCP